ncbi:MAG: RNA 3'-terminal phosphate cyclase [Planctomycetaceae bacterium]|jgi:RNA 3'-terminal phosphate cyclase (ATP)|nr:RNA 3'-terminal phosphate cyclase [Phycisphaerales bacterium]MCE2652681.1 RNA 3'-terminal phosphate cyclase [Planctomycetaceae bacterium]
MPQALEIDGSQGEGGGQILRTALALSMITGTPIRMRKIRAGRRKPGLMRQHLTCVRAAQAVCGASVRQAEIGSTELAFTPGPEPVRADDYRFAIGTAGSTSLVLQTVLPALLLADGVSTVTISGGTHNDMAPSADFLERAFVPLLARMGWPVHLTLQRHGFYPAGGGQINALITGRTDAAQLTVLSLTERGQAGLPSCTVLLSGLAQEIGEREVARVREHLDIAPERCAVVNVDRPMGPGNAVLITLPAEHCTEVVMALGDRGLSAYAVADRAVQEARAYLNSGVPVGPHLADQLLLPLALLAHRGAGPSAFVTGQLTEHTRTNMDVINTMLPVRCDAEPTERNDGSVLVRVMSH